VDGEEITLGISTPRESGDAQTVAERLGELLAPMEEHLSDGRLKGKGLVSKCVQVVEYGSGNKNVERLICGEATIV
jgi:hypothetical protein